MNIQEAIKTGKPFRRMGWMNEDVFAMYSAHDIVLVLESDPLVPVELDVQDILADDWYTRDQIHVSYALPKQVIPQPMYSHRREPAE